MRRPRAKAPRQHPRARRSIPLPLVQVGDHLTPKETAAYLRISVPKLYQLLKEDTTFPAAIRITPRRAVRRRADVDRWVTEQITKEGQTL